MKNIQLDKKEIELITSSLQCRICIMETGTSYLRVNDAIESGQREYIQPLTKEQRDVIQLLENLVLKLEVV